MKSDDYYLSLAVEIAAKYSYSGENGPFGAVIVKDNKIIAEGWNEVVKSHDPTAHAEIVAIRKACKTLDSFSLTGCTIYSSCEPCPMCLSAIIWARIDRVVYAEGREAAANAGFDDQKIYHAIEERQLQEIVQMERIKVDSSIAPFKAWLSNPLRKKY
ncbi:nucleoside deaminase [Aliikangiella sp. G2MR2-5]|uniref:nucleoside deaminase n=1 Tax=Aliikangiella sp. G2MR2-5 TaxID=2788943 RepID=UPI0018AAB55F|nr:nucleoside deaminase [Aliikangiella sp. G2MR2-5]